MQKEVEKVFMRRRDDCMTACLATVLKVPYESVPLLFGENGEDLPDWKEKLDNFLASHGYQLMEVRCEAEHVGRLKGMLICWGLSGNAHYASLGYTHAVIYKDGELFHDPCPPHLFEKNIVVEGMNLLVPIL
jgi:hypothetical protein